MLVQSAAAPSSALDAAHAANEQHAFQEGLKHALRGLAKATAPETRAQLLLERSVAEFHLGDAHACVSTCQEALELPCAPLTRAELEAQASVAERHLGLRVRALEGYLRALTAIDGRTEDRADQLRATLHNNIAVLVLGQGDLHRAVEHFQRGLGIRTSPMMELQQRINLGRVLLRLERPEEAVTHLERANTLAADLPEAMRYRAQEGLASAKQALGDLEEAARLARPCVAFWTRQGHPTMEALSHLTLARALAALGDPEAEQHFLQAAELDFRDVQIGSATGLAALYEAQGRFEEACRAHRRHRELLEERFDQARSQAFEELRLHHEMDRKERESDLLRVRTVELESVIRERTEELRRQNDELERARDTAMLASHAKSRFLAMISHELRTPLNAIVGYTELLQDDLEDPEVQEDLGRIHHAADRLLDLIDRILALTGLEAHIDPGDVEELDVRALLEELRAEKGDRIVVTCDVDRWTTWPQHVRGALAHLLDNALRFTTGPVRLSALPGPLLVVEDDGPGVPPARLTALMTPFTQADMSATRRHEGLGLGLALTGHHVRLLGGELQVLQTAAGGTRFELRLP